MNYVRSNNLSLKHQMQIGKCLVRKKGKCKLGNVFKYTREVWIEIYIDIIKEKCGLRYI